MDLVYRSFLLGLVLSCLSFGAQACLEGNSIDDLKKSQLDFFNYRDHNKDGFLSFEEFLPYPEYGVHPDQARDTLFKNLDENKDELLSFKEWEKEFPYKQFYTDGC